MRSSPIVQCLSARHNFGPNQFGDAADEQDVSGYADCLGVRNTLNENYSFAHSVRGLIDEESGVWGGDVVRTTFSHLSRGLRTIDAEMTVADCAARSIPTV